MKNLKKIFALLIILNFTTNSLCDDLFLNSIFYRFGWNTDFIIFSPGSKSDYEIIKRYPLTAYLFIDKFNDKSIYDLKVEELKSCNFTGEINYSPEISSEPYNYKYIAGFENYANELIKIDEFDLLNNKPKFTDKLYECWQNYINEYNKLKENTCVIALGYNHHEIEYDQNEYHTKGNNKFNNSIKKYAIKPWLLKLQVNDYDFENQLMRFQFPCFGELCGNKPNFNWTQYVDSACSNYFLQLSKESPFTESIEPELAKKLIQDNIYGYWNARIKLKDGFWNYNIPGVSTPLVQKFEILSLKLVFRKMNVDKKGIVDYKSLGGVIYEKDFYP